MKTPRPGKRRGGAFCCLPCPVGYGGAMPEGGSAQTPAAPQRPSGGARCFERGNAALLPSSAPIGQGTRLEGRLWLCYKGGAPPCCAGVSQLAAELSAACAPPRVFAERHSGGFDPARPWGQSGDAWDEAAYLGAAACLLCPGERMGKRSGAKRGKGWTGAGEG